MVTASTSDDKTTYTFQNESTGLYINSDLGLSSEAASFTIAKVDEKSCFKVSNANSESYKWDGNGWTNCQMVSWAGDGHEIYFYSFTEADELCDITINATVNGNVIGTKTYTIAFGGELYNVDFNALTRVGSVSGTADGDATYNIEYTVNDGTDIRFLGYQAFKNNAIYSYIYADSDNNRLIHKNGNTLANDEHTLFRRIDAGSGNYYLYSPSANRFVGSISESPVPLVTVDKAQTFTFEHSTNMLAERFRNSSATSSSNQYANAYNYTTDGGNVGNWYAYYGGESEGSLWFVMLNDNQEQFNTNLAQYNDFLTAYNAAKSKSTSTWVNSTADCMNSNYPAVDSDGTVYDGGGYAALIDDNTDTFFHTAWTSKGDISNGYNTINHDLQIRMSDNTKSHFYVQYTPRSSYAATPTAMNIYGATGSTDDWNAIEWESTPFATVSGLSTSGGTFYINAKGKVYTALKFEMTTVSGSTGKYYNYSGFKLYATDVFAPTCTYADETVNAVASTTIGETSTTEFASRLAALTAANNFAELFSNNYALYTLHNCDDAADRGYAVATDDSEYFEQGYNIDATDSNNLWGLIGVDGQYYLYNYGKKQFANAYGDQSDSNTANHEYSWRLSNVPTPVTIQTSGYSLPNVAIIGGENNIDSRDPGMMTFNSGSHRIVVCNGCGSNRDGNGWLFSKVSTTATEDEINALLANKSAAETTVNDQFSALPEASDDNAKVVGNYTNSALEAMAELSDDATADAKHHAMESAERVNLTPDAVYTLKGSDSDKYYCVNSSDVQDFLAKDELTNANLFNWIAVSNDNGTISFVHKVNDGESSSASAPAMRRAVKSTITLTIDDQKEFTPTFPEVGVTALNGANTVITFESNDQTVADTVTAISEITVDGNNADAAIYDLQGRRVNTVTGGGIYIVGGRKVRL